MSETVTVVNGATQAVTVGGGGIVHNVSVSHAPSIQAASINASIQPVNVVAGIESASIAATIQPMAGVSASVFVGGPASGVAAISQASDIAFSNLSDGDVLRFSQTRWRNYSERQLTDGGNF